MRKPRNKPQLEIREPGPERIHDPKIARSHISQEFRDRRQYDLATEAIRHLRPPFKACATGEVNANYVYQAMPVIIQSPRLNIKGMED